MQMKTQPTNERKSGKKRVMVQIWSVLAKAIDKQFKELHIKRDGYLNDLFTREIEALADEVTFRNSDEVRKRFRERPIPDRVKLNLDLDETLIQRMDEVLKEKNIPRDSFVNRILFFLIAKDAHLEYLGVDYDTDSPATAKPLSDAKGYLLNPFFHIRGKNDDAFYTLACFTDGPFGTAGPNLFGLNTAISDDSWAAMNIDTDALLAKFGLLPDEEAGHATN
jgi:hypothetical protein